jgi:glutamate dehydrogenase/leucine dehydrogenase
MVYKKNDYVVCHQCKTQLELLEELNIFSPKELSILKNPERVINVNYPVRMDNGDIELFSAFRVQYNNALGPTKGGIRFHPTVNQEEVSELSFLMTLKNSLAGLPYGGAKGGVKINPEEYSKGEIERVSRGFVRELFDFLGPNRDIPAPDVNTNAQIMAWMSDEYETIARGKFPGTFTGKPIVLGGSLGREASTARGAFFIAQEILKNKKPGDISIAIQGFGNVGGNAARIFNENGYTKVVAISDASGGVYNKDGLPIQELLRHQKSGKKLSDFKAEKISNSDLLKLDVDLLIPAALGGVITKENAGDIRAKVILEVANAPVMPDADSILEEKNIIVIPDILANSGGVIVSYFEWVQNTQNYYWTEEGVDMKLKGQITNAYQNVLREKEEKSLTFRQASYVYAVRKIIEAEKLRGGLDS